MAAPKGNQFYKMAVEKGYVEAMYNLSLVYGDTNKKDLSIKYMKMAAENGSEKAKSQLKAAGL